MHFFSLSEAGPRCTGGSTDYDLAFVAVSLRRKTGWLWFFLYFLNDFFSFNLLLFIHDVEVVLFYFSETHFLPASGVTRDHKHHNEDVEEK